VRSDRALHTLLLMVGVVGFSVAGWQRLHPTAPTGFDLPTLVGRKYQSIPILGDSGSTVDTLPLAGRGIPTLIYAFSTECGFCSRQKARIGALLASARQVQVVSVSSEPKAKTRSYWISSGFTLPEPITVDGRVLTRMGLDLVPTLLLLDTSGTVRRAVGGMILGWDSMAFQQFLEFGSPRSEADDRHPPGRQEAASKDAR